MGGGGGMREGEGGGRREGEEDAQFQKQWMCSHVQGLPVQVVDVHTCTCPSAHPKVP